VPGRGADTARLSGSDPRHRQHRGRWGPPLPGPDSRFGEIDARAVNSDRPPPGPDARRRPPPPDRPRTAPRLDL